MSTNEKLEKTVRDKPILQHVLDLRIVGRAVAAGVVAALLFWLLVGPATAGFALLLVFFGSWFVLARLSHDRRRESEPADGERSEGTQGEGQPAGAG
jgi:Flp pilus assembly protein TadB